MTDFRKFESNSVFLCLFECILCIFFFYHFFCFIYLFNWESLMNLLSLNLLVFHSITNTETFYSSRHNLSLQLSPEEKFYTIAKITVLKYKMINYYEISELIIFYSFRSSFAISILLLLQFFFLPNHWNYWLKINILLLISPPFFVFLIGIMSLTRIWSFVLQ